MFKFVKSALAATALGTATLVSAGPAWWQEGMVYEIYPRSFLDTDGSGMGDLKGITQKLPYLEKLGINAIWLTPIYPSPGVDNGYDISDYADIDPKFGSLADFDELVAQGRRHGIRVVMDLVFNHSSDQHEWFLKSRASRDNPYSDYYIWRDPKPDGSAPTNWRSIFGGPAWTYCKERNQYYLHTFAAAQPDLNWENPAVREALYEIANFWVKRGVGGFRIDAITYIKKPAQFKDGPVDGGDGLSGIHALTANSPGILDFLHEFKDRVRAGQDIFTVGEANGVRAADLPLWLGERGVFDMIFEFSHLSLALKHGERWSDPTPWTIPELKQALDDTQRVTARGMWCPVFFENHDQPRSVEHFLPPGADHDAGTKALATLLLTLRGTPFIYQGEELGLPNTAFERIGDYNDISSHGQYEQAIKDGKTPEDALQAVQYFSRDNARIPMPWTDGAHWGFTSGTPWLATNPQFAGYTAAREEADPQSVLRYYRRLHALRKTIPELRAGDYTDLLPDDPRLFVFRRSLGHGSVVTVVNLSNEYATIRPDLIAGQLLIGTHADPSPTLLKPLEGRVYDARRP